jgi:hypothetical protein
MLMGKMKMFPLVQFLEMVYRKKNASQERNGEIKAWNFSRLMRRSLSFRLHDAMQ